MEIGSEEGQKFCNAYVLYLLVIGIKFQKSIPFLLPSSKSFRLLTKPFGRSTPIYTCPNVTLTYQRHKQDMDSRSN